MLPSARDLVATGSATRLDTEPADEAGGADGVGDDGGAGPRDAGRGVEGASSWRRHSRRVAYENAWIRVLHDEVTRPDGEPGIYGVVHFHGRAVGVVALGDDGRILLVGQYRYTLDRYSWELPEGGVPEDEDLLEGARRELVEETGYEALRWRELVRLHLSNSVTDEAGTLFVAEGLVPGEARPEGTEELATRWVTLGEALALIDDGTITDAMTQIGILRHALERGPLAPGGAEP